MQFQISRSLASKPLLALVLFVIGLIYAALVFWDLDFAPGWDSYFYIVQAKSWVESGELHSSRTNLIYPLLIGAYYVLNDYELAYKLITILAFAGFAPAVFLIAEHWVNSFKWTFLIALIALINPHTVYFASQFTKNLLAVDLGLFVLYISTSKRFKSRFLNYSLPSVLYYSHKLVLGLVGVFALLELVVRYFKKLLKFPMAILPIILFPTFFITVHLLFGLDTFFTFRPRFVLFQFFRTHQDVLTLPWIISLCLSFGLLVLALINWGSISVQQKAFLLLLIVLIFPFLKWDTLGISFRLFMTFGLISPLCLTVFRPQMKSLLFVVLTLGLLSLSIITHKTYSPQKHDPPNWQYKFLTGKIDQFTNEHEVKLLIAHKSFAEYITFELGIDVLPWGVEGDLNKIYRVVYLPSFLQSIISVDFKKLSASYIVVKESDFKKLLSQIDEIDRELVLNWKNPTEVRPFYLAK